MKLIILFSVVVLATAKPAAEPAADATADAALLYGYGGGYYPYVGNGGYRGGFGHPYFSYWKRSADAEPTPDAEPVADATADAALFYGYGGGYYPYAGYGGYRGGLGHPYGFGYAVNPWY